MPDAIEPQRDPGSVMRGFAVAAGINLAALVVGGVTMIVGIGIVIIMGYGLLQGLWLLPLLLRYRKSKQTESAKGVLIAMGISFLLSCACWGVFVNSGPIGR